MQKRHNDKCWNGIILRGEGYLYNVEHILNLNIFSLFCAKQNNNTFHCYNLLLSI